LSERCRPAGAASRCAVGGENPCLPRTFSSTPLTPRPRPRPAARTFSSTALAVRFDHELNHRDTEARREIIGLQISKCKMQNADGRNRLDLPFQICNLKFSICNCLLCVSVSLWFKLSVHSITPKINFRSANHERNAIPASRWCESVVKVF
jgi:hypothetical protein